MTAIVERPSPNHDARPAGAGVDTLVIHYTDMTSAAAALDRLCDPAARVSAHYLIDRGGGVYRLVAEDRRAWHAGESFWRGRAGLNANTIGIELDNPGHGHGYVPFPDVQMAALIGLCRDIVTRHDIAGRNVVGHSDIAPRRKADPGELFDWPGLAAAGIGLWPEKSRPEAPDAAVAGNRLAAIGYETVDMAATLTAFQRRYRSRRIDGVLDAETMGLTAAVLTRCQAGGA